MIVVAVNSSEVERICRRLADLGAEPLDVLSPGGDRRLVLADASSTSEQAGTSREAAAGSRADTGEAGDQASTAARLRAEGEMAVARPDSGAALRAWQRDTAPVICGDRVSVCLAHSEHDRSGLPNVVELGPGGFGNGRHPSTRLVIEMLADSFGSGERNPMSGARVLDVGCGSGILGLVALALGAGEVTAVDQKPEAVAATRRNAAINGWADRLQATVVPARRAEPTGADAGQADPEPTGAVEPTKADSEPSGADLGLGGPGPAADPLQAQGGFDLVLANIARAGIAALADCLVRSVGPAGKLIVSGISPGQRSQAEAHLAPLTVVECRSEGDWAALALARNHD